MDVKSHFGVVSVEIKLLNLEKHLVRIVGEELLADFLNGNQQEVKELPNGRLVFKQSSENVVVGDVVEQSHPLEQVLCVLGLFQLELWT